MSLAGTASDSPTLSERIQSIVDAIFKILLLAVPISILGHVLEWDPLIIFVAAAISLLPLANYLGQVTEELAIIAGPTIGGLMNATFGNAAELIIGLVALRSGLVEVVKASITGSMISNLLLVAGLAMFLGGLKYKEQTFQPVVARVNASAMNLAVIALLLPTVVAATVPNLGELSIQNLSVIVAIVLIVVYILTLVFSIKTHSYLYDLHDSEAEEADTPEESNSVLEAQGSIPQILKAETKSTSVWTLIGLLSGIAILVAIESELLVDTLETVLKDIGITELFLGVILLPVIGNAAEHATAVTVAVKDKMDLSLSVALGSTLQIALFVGPLLVLVGSLINQPMDFQFQSIELVGVGVSVLIVNSVSSDGRSNWLEGLMLLATYALLAVTFFFIPG